MSSRDPATPDSTDDDAEDTEAPEGATDADALTLALAEAEAADATAAAARAEVLRLQRQRAPAAEGPAAESAGDEQHEAPTAPESSESEATAAEPVDEADRSRRFGRGWKWLRWVAATLTVLAVGGLIAASVLLVLHHRDVQARQQQAAEYLAAARQGVVTLMSVNFNTVDDDVRRILDNSTGDFKKDFEEHAEDFTAMARESKAVTEATATSAAIESMTDTGAVALVAVNTKVTNEGGAVDEPRNWRLAVTLARDDGQVKISNVEFAP